MSDIENLRGRLFEDKYNPTEFKKFILVDRIKKEFPDGKVTKHVLLYGHSGTGKSSLLKCLLRGNCMYINSKVDGGVALLRRGSKLYDYCDGFSFEGGQKYVFFDEIDGVSPDFFDGLKGFMDTFKNVIFVATTNHINEIPHANLSRFRKIDFDFKSEAERSEHLLKYTIRVKSILKKEGIEADDKTIKKMASMYHPDMRGVLQAIQTISESGEDKVEHGSVHKAMMEFSDVFDLSISKGIGEQKNIAIHQCATSKTNCTEIIRTFDDEFFKYVKEERSELVAKYGKMVIVIAEHNDMLSNRVSPTLVLKSLMYSLNMISNS